ncbi:MAG TPA: hypothetical protein VJM14_05375 [Burkholderiales bacterium]|nr:hypothetical protein [Burkholderiales bacterium]
MREPFTATAGTAAGSTEYGPWNPGLQSELPWRLLPLSTLFRPENVFTTVDEVHELSDVTGLKADELVVFRPERLLVHELLIRVTADFSVPDGPRVEDLGINFRRLAETLLTRYVAPHAREIAAAYESLKASLSSLIDTELATALAALSSAAGVAPARQARAGGLLGLLRRPQRKAVSPGRDECWAHEERVVGDWAAKAQSSEDLLRKAAYRALVRVASAVRSRHGRMWGDQRLLAPIATGIACNEHGAEVIGRLIEPYLREAAEREAYRLLPAQAQPVVMNTKGASASGKSTMRPLQRALAAKLDVEWTDFALISPDIWRKFLLDYGALGEHYKYAGAFTARELAIVDQKLDRYMARKAERRGMSHLLIDRFRFDSFAPDSDEAGSNLLTRFGRLVYLFFMITPPHETVERAWRRGLEVGRYKAVDDVLAQNIEAYAGMPELFFTWALRPNMSVHYEFLDNSVPLGERPRTAAFGRNGELNILDVKCMLDVDRYRKINIEAAGPREVYPDPRTMDVANNTQFLTRCARELPAVNFADRETGRVYARIESGRLAWTEPEALAQAVADAETRAGLFAVAAEALSGARLAPGSKRLTDVVPADRLHTLGQWGAGISKARSS